jgi:5-methylcytosine-specific restriction enzyme subunit McrC
VAQSDLYQMYAYANTYNCSNVVLLYPHHKELGSSPGVRSNYLLNPRMSEFNQVNNKKVKVASIDLADLTTIPTQLRRILEK